MTFAKTAAVATLAVAAVLGSTLTAANAGKKHGHLPHHHHHHHHHKFHNKLYGPTIVIGTPGYGCKRWLRLYHKTGKKKFLNRYYACIY